MWFYCSLFGRAGGIDEDDGDADGSGGGEGISLPGLN